MRRNSKNTKDLIFKIILSALLTANTVFTGINSYNINKIAKNTKNPANVSVNTFILNNNNKVESEQKDTITYPSNIYFDANQYVETNEIKEYPYIINQGDKLSDIVNFQYGRYDYSLLMALAQYNNIENVDKIYTGDIIYLPSEEELNKIISQNNGFITKTKPQTKSSTKEQPVLVSSNETKKEVKNTQSDNSAIKSELSDVKEDIQSNTNKISTLEAKVNENTNNISSLESKVEKNTDNIESTNTTVNKNFDDIIYLYDKVETNSDDIDSVNEKLDNHKIFADEEKQKINDRIDSLEQSWRDGSLSIEYILEKLSDMEKAIDDLTNNSITKEETMTVIDDSDVKEEFIPQDEAIIPEEDEILPVEERIKEFDIPFVEENEPQTDAKVPFSEEPTVKEELIPEEEVIITEDSENNILPVEEKVESFDLPISEENIPASEEIEQQTEEVEKSKQILPPSKQIENIYNLPEMIIAYTKTR